MRRLRERYPFCAVVQHRPAQVAEADGLSYGQRLNAAETDIERIEAFLTHVRDGHAISDAEDALINEVLDERVRAEVAR